MATITGAIQPVYNVNEQIGPKGTGPGGSITMPTVNTDLGGIAIPLGATGLNLVIETSDTVTTPVRGRIVFNASAAGIGVVADSSTSMGHHPAQFASYRVPSNVTHLHLASPTALAVARLTWLSA